MHIRNLSLALLAFVILTGEGCLGGRVAPEPTTKHGEPLDGSGLNCRNIDLAGDGAPVHVFKLDDGRCYPSGIFTKPTAPDKCRHTHYHYTLLSLDGETSRHDEGKDCGAATNDDVENKGTVYVSNDVINAWNEKWKTLSAPGTDVGDFSIE